MHTATTPQAFNEFAGRPLADHPLAAVFEGCVERRDYPEEPLYEVLSRLIARSPQLLALMDAAPPTQRRAMLILAALHAQVLEAADRGAPASALAAYYASVGGRRAPDAALSGALEAFVQTHETTLRAVMASHRTQTNEVGRCTVLWPALAEIARQSGRPRLALFDFGCSAGLNLGVDRYRIAYRQADEVRHVGPHHPAAPELSCRVLNRPLPPALLADSAWHLTARAGVDQATLDVHNDHAMRWLRACLWPSDQARADRLKAAAALAREARDPVHQAEDGLAVLDDWLRQLPADTTPVLFNSWVLAYFGDEDLRRHRDRVLARVQSHGLWWLSAEDGERCRATTGLEPPASPLPGEARNEAASHTFWTLSAPGETAPRHQLVARSHPHGAWLEWWQQGS
ncbi:DUF2332 family protein [Ideonella sp.]|uniref:DUF2332 family protein n=1 Tax=Ideonella sp. TaxID=1929293 RepID=UPI0035B29555